MAAHSTPPNFLTSSFTSLTSLTAFASSRAESLSIEDMEDAFTAFTEWELPDYARNNSHRGDYLASLLLDKEPTQDTPPTTEDAPNQPARLGNLTCKVSDLACKVSTPTASNLASSARFFDRYIARNYKRIYGLSRGANSGSKGGRSHTDILHDTLLSMRDEASQFSSYEAFEAWANAKFTPKYRRQNPQITDKPSEPNERE